MRLSAADLKATRERCAAALLSARKLGEEWRGQTDDKVKAETREKFDRAMADFKVQKQALDAHDAAEEVERQIELLNAPENQLPVYGQGTEKQTEKKKAAHKAATETFLRHGMQPALRILEDGGFSRPEIHALVGTTANLGGFAIDHDFRAELLRAMSGFAVIRSSGARVIPTGARRLVMPTLNGSGNSMYSSDLNASNAQATGTPSSWKSEGHTVDGNAPPTQSRPRFGQLEIDVHIWQPDAIEITQELLEDTQVPLDSLIAELLGEVKSLDEDWAYIAGNGSGKPEGLLIGITQTTTGASNATVKYSDFIDLFTQTPAQYRQNAKFMMNSKTFGSVLKLEGGDGADYGWPIFPPNALPGTIFGKPVLFSEFMPDEGASKNPVIFGDFRYYYIAERTDIRLQRLVERFAPNLAIMATARNGGKLSRTEPMRMLAQPS
jgi:HK97 family phage major capsid protein